MIFSFRGKKHNELAMFHVKKAEQQQWRSNRVQATHVIRSSDLLDPNARFDIEIEDIAPA